MKETVFLRADTYLHMEIARVTDLGPDRRKQLFERQGDIGEIRGDVSAILTAVEQSGDEALREYTELYDDVVIHNFDITADLERAVDAVDSETLDAIDNAIANVQEFHEQQLPNDWRADFSGRELGRRFRPLERIGAYVPGGTAAYPSSAIMTVVPAKVAGVEQVVVTTPPGDPVNSVTLAALQRAGADAVYQVGGAQAIGALAHGTETISPVDKIVGPGNRWVTAAKSLVRETVAIDFLAGPSEILVIADDTADPGFVASDLLAQAEHGPRSPCVLVTDSETIAESVRDELTERLRDVSRPKTIRTALESEASGLFLVRSMSEAISFANTYSSEHLSIQATNDEEILDRIDNAGSVFLGPYTPVAAGDYASGTNHVLPTGGMASYVGGLSVDTFLRATTVQRLTQSSLDSLAPTIIQLAGAEGLTAHAASVQERLGSDE